MPTTMAAASSSSITSLSPHHLSHFTPIEEGNEEEENSQGLSSFRETTPSSCSTHQPTPLHHHHQNASQVKAAKGSTRKRPESSADADGDDGGGGVLCNKCRPSNREKISVVPLDNGGVHHHHHHHHKLSMASPNGIIKSIFSSLTKRSPRSTTTTASEDSSTVSREDQWKVAVSELSHKLIQATRKRDEAVGEVSRLKYSMAELEKKLNKLEIYCQNLKSNLEAACSSSTSSSSSSSSSQQQKKGQLLLQLDYKCIKVGDSEKVIQHFLVAVSEARSSTRLLSRSLTLNLRQQQLGGGGNNNNKVYERISQLLQSYDIKVSWKNPRGLLFYLEALLNKSLFEDFECMGFQKSSPTRILNPIDSCEANFAAFGRLQGLTWEEVLSKGTRHFSEDFSRFCDRKMSEIVALLGWSRAWPEQLLQAFFCASKAVWLVHLLANSVHPGLPVFRVDKSVRFDPVYMEDMGGDKARKLVPSLVRIMVAPGFYVYDNVVKCKVLSRYNNSNNNNNDESRLTPSPTY